VCVVRLYLCSVDCGPVVACTAGLVGTGLVGASGPRRRLAGRWPGDWSAQPAQARGRRGRATAHGASARRRLTQG